MPPERRPSRSPSRSGSRAREAAPSDRAYYRIAPNFLDESTFDPGSYAEELAAPSAELGTRLWFENDRVRVWELRLGPGERAPFHRHDTPYFWTCVEGGIGRQRMADGTVRVRRYEAGDTEFAVHSPLDAKVHDQENAGDSMLRFMTVELIDASSHAAGKAAGMGR